MAKMYHIAMEPGDVGRYVLLPGDPGRVEKIGCRFDNPREVAYNREFHTITGTLDGVPVSVTSTGIGGPSLAICVEELHMIGADTFIRVGTCGGMALKVKTGDIIVSTGAIRQEGTSKEYMPLEFPAVSDYDTTTALVQACRELGYPMHTGVIQSKDSFYGQHNPERMPIANTLLNNWQAWLAGGCLASEMESGTLFILASYLGARASSVNCCLGNQERRKKGLQDDKKGDIEMAIDVAILALRKLIAQDQAGKQDPA